MIMTNRFVELPLVEPLYQTYQYQGASSAIIANNPSVRNWLLNEVMNLTCDRRFLSGFTTPNLTIQNSEWYNNPCLEKYRVPLRFVKGYMNPIIREMLNNGYYVNFAGVDDFYIPGKAWYRERHFSHDGLICGYNQQDKTFCMYAYDSNWIYRKFWVPQRAFNIGCAAMLSEGRPSSVTALKANVDVVEFSPKTACERIVEYLDSSFENYPIDGKGPVFGIVVHAYIAEYVTKLFDGSIPYDRMDRRVFRVIWEHKKAMLERMQAMEQMLNIDNTFSEKYKVVVSEADLMRMMYAHHHMKRRDSVLPTIRKKLLDIMELESNLLTDLVEVVERGLENETLETH